MSQLELPLPEISTDDFCRSWTRFELVAAAKKWNSEKQLTVIPALLRGKLVDYYVELGGEVREDLGQLKTALMLKAGISRDPLNAAQTFTSRSQGPQEKVLDFVSDLKKLFKEAYPREAASSSVLLQRFLTGLQPAISQQILLKGRPEDLESAIQTANDVEYALRFNQPQRELQITSQSKGSNTDAHAQVHSIRDRSSG